MKIISGIGMPRYDQIVLKAIAHVYGRDHKTQYRFEPGNLEADIIICNLDDPEGQNAFRQCRLSTSQLCKLCIPCSEKPNTNPNIQHFLHRPISYPSFSNVLQTLSTNKNNKPKPPTPNPSIIFCYS